MELKPFYDGQEADWAVQRGSQELFLNTRTYEVLYTGNRGGGKTACLLMSFAQFCGRGFGSDWKGILFRHTYPELKDIVDKSRQLFPKIWPGAKFNETKMTWTWPDGEQLLFRHMEHEKDYLSYHGHAYPWIGWEELTTWADSGCYTRMMSCCRSANPMVPRMVRATTNPYGPGFNWVKSRFELPLPPGVIYGPLISDPDIGDRRAINSDLRENQVLLRADPDYIKRIRASARNEAELAAWLHGSWDIISGGMFDDIWLRVKDAMCVQPFQVPPSWRIDKSFDWGSTKPFSVGWWAESDGSPYTLPGGKRVPTVKGDLFRIKEWYGWDGKNPNKGIRMLAKDIAKGIVERELRWGIHERVRRGVADAAIFDDTNNNSVARDMEESVVIDGVRYRGVYFDPADKRSGTRKQGWEQMRKMMAAVLPAEGQKIREEPGLFVTRECTQFLRTVPTIPRDPDDLDDVDTDAEDHVADEVRYRCRKEHRTVKGGKTVGLV
ncbi:MAG: terminase [Phycisphaerales bacterium]|nr:terminase [Phycisphaerales bacterium]